MQLTEIYKYSVDDLRTIQGLAEDHNMPYDTDLWLAMLEISRLRQRVAAGARLGLDTVRSIFNTIDDSDTETWSKIAIVNNEDMTPEVAKIYQVATRLYGIMTLPPKAVLAAYPQAGSYATLRVTERRRLVALLDENLPNIKRIIAFDWPLVVAGAASGTDGEDVEALMHQAVVGEWFHKLTIDIRADVVSIGTYEKLRMFWKSRTTEWEDCFTEPRCL